MQDKTDQGTENDAMAASIPSVIAHMWQRIRGTSELSSELVRSAAENLVVFGARS